MEQRTGPSQQRPRPQAPLAGQAPLVEGAVYRVAARPGSPDRAGGTGKGGQKGQSRDPGRSEPPVPPVVQALRRLPDARLTGLGAGLFSCAAMLLVGMLDQLLFDGSTIVYGVFFLLLSALTALSVRSADLVTAPISVPIAFAVGSVPISGGLGGLGGQIMAVVTVLAVNAGWLYGGTLIAGLITCVRKVRLMMQRRTNRRPDRPPGRRPTGVSAGPSNGPRPAGRGPGQTKRRPGGARR
ncbi:DUF6542 domain-containing protein [Streptomyces sp. FIT100]|uniref:DUF6542 domain-containing protein n=1 Tax=Streptomyces sp. FIT100 TaxID=2837956 RepID=UPI0037D9C3F4